jgi:hypothetical protein
MTDVKCKVESCYYWGKGDVCKADTITVDNNTGTAGRMEAADLTVGPGTGERARDFEAGDLTTGPFTGPENRQGTRTAGGKTGVLARTSHETLCSTFKPKNAGPMK